MGFNSGFKGLKLLFSFIKHYFVKGKVEVEILAFLSWSREGRQP